MRRKPVTSSMIRSVGYSRKERALEVEFVHGAVYRYFDVPRSEYEGLISSESKGSYFNGCIRGAYPYEQL